MLLDKLGLGDRIVLSPDQLVEAALDGKVVPIDALSERQHQAFAGQWRAASRSDGL